MCSRVGRWVATSASDVDQVTSGQSSDLGAAAVWALCEGTFKDALCDGMDTGDQRRPSKAETRLMPITDRSRSHGTVEGDAHCAGRPMQDRNCRAEGRDRYCTRTECYCPSKRMTSIANIKPTAIPTSVRIGLWR